MLPDQVLRELNDAKSKIPRDALRAAAELRIELTPLLLELLSRGVEHPDEWEKDPESDLPFYAMYLLASWREPQAHPVLLKFLRLPGERALELSGDIITQDMAWMLAQTWNRDASLLEALAIDRSVNEWSRSAAVSALTLLTQWNEQSSESVREQFLRIIASARQDSDPSRNEIALGSVVGGVLDLQLVDLRAEVLALFDEGYIQNTFVVRDEVVEELGKRLPKIPPPPVTDVAKAIRWWGCFGHLCGDKASDLDIITAEDKIRAENLTLDLRKTRESTSLKPNWDDALLTAFDMGSSDESAPQPYHAPSKVGRNDPCLCGSGKKYKKCCGAS